MLPPCNMYCNRTYIMMIEEMFAIIDSIGSRMLLSTEMFKDLRLILDKNIGCLNI